MFLRAFASTCLKFSIYFSTRTYFFLFYAITFQKHLHQIMYYTFCLFKLLLLFSFSFTLSLSLSLKYQKIQNNTLSPHFSASHLSRSKECSHFSPLRRCYFVVASSSFGFDDSYGFVYGFEEFEI